MLKTVTISIEPALIERIDIDAKGRDISRSRYIVDALEQHFEPVRGEAALMLRDLEHTKQVLSIREAELNEAKDLNARLWLEWKEANDRLVMYQLPAPTKPRRSLWQWLRRAKV